MSDKTSTPENRVIIAAGPGANPSSFPKFDTAVDPQAGLPDEQRHGGKGCEMPSGQNRGNYIDLPGGGHIAPNGAVIHDPCSDIPEVLPDNEYTPDKEDLDLLIM